TRFINIFRTRFSRKAIVNPDGTIDPERSMDGSRWLSGCDLPAM
ncbi:MAG: hypothetical protein ACI814_004108, partial [Mariniblastus sp.]